ncbi:ribosome biogenesis protein [Candidatus Woesearchaeota archaeon]|nr:ribosome biogenesis protein [Candidatus Woesearchaeota archaeon]
MNKLLKCTACSEYTLHSPCSCGNPARSPRPVKFSIEDKYGNYRRKAKGNQHVED